MNDYKSILSHNLKRIMGKSWKDVSLAAKIYELGHEKIIVSVITKARNGDSVPRGDNLYLIAQALGVTVEELFRPPQKQRTTIGKDLK